MVLCFCSGVGSNRDEVDLCLVPDKPDALSVPVRIRDLRPTVAAFHRVGADEGVTVMYSDEDNGVIVAATTPGSIYLTPNLMQSPGFRVRKVKIYEENGEFKTLYEKEGKGWEPWVANRER